MGILDSIVEWIATQVMNLLDLITGSVLGALVTTLYLQARQAAIKSLVDVLPLEPVTATTFKFFCLSRQALAIS